MHGVHVRRAGGDLARVDEAEVAQLRLARHVQQHVVRLQVAVHDRRPPRVQVRHALGDLHADADRAP